MNSAFGVDHGNISKGLEGEVQHVVRPALKGLRAAAKGMAAEGGGGVKGFARRAAYGIKDETRATMNLPRFTYGGDKAYQAGGSKAESAYQAQNAHLVERRPYPGPRRKA